MASSPNEPAGEENNSSEEESEPCHIMLSYQWDNQKLVEKIYNYLKKAQTLPVWMDVHGGMQNNVFDSMSHGVQGCSVMICFLTPAYQESENCKRELSYALGTGTAIIPCLIGSKELGNKWKPSNWLGMSIADILYLDFSGLENNETKLQIQCQELLRRVNAAIPNS